MAAGLPSATAICRATRSTPVHLLGDRVLDLQPGVHLQEVEAVAGSVVEELDGAGPDVVHRARPPRGPRRAARGGSAAEGAGAGDSSTTFWWRRWSEQSRSPNTSIVPCAVAHDLYLDVTSALDVRLDEDGAVPERRLRLRRSRRDLGIEPVRGRGRPASRGRRHPRTPSPAAGGRPRWVTRGASSTGTPAARTSSFALIFEPIASIDSGRRADPGQAGRRGPPGRSRRSPRGTRSRGAPRRRPARRAASSSRSIRR